MATCVWPFLSYTSSKTRSTNQFVCGKIVGMCEYIFPGRDRVVSLAEMIDRWEIELTMFPTDVPDN